MNILRLTLRMLQRDWRAGELTLLSLALMLAVASLTSVDFLTDRVAQALTLESHQLLGGDLLISSDRPQRDVVRQEARRSGLHTADSIGFPAMVSADSTSQLAEIKAVGPGYPLRGALRQAPSPNAPDNETRDIPEPGTVWLDERLAAALHVQPGVRIRIGEAELRFAAVLTQEPDRAMSIFGMAPHLLMHIDDLPATGLIQPASRVAFRLHLAGDPSRIAEFSRWAQTHLDRGERIEDMSNARPEVRIILDRAQRFLRLAALLAVVLAAVAAGFSADRYMRRHLDGCAVMRCLGAQQSQIVLIHGGEFLLFGLMATLAGCIAGYAAQWALQGWLAGLLLESLPASSWMPWIHGILVGLVLVAGFTAPPLLRLRGVSTLRVLRREWIDVAPLSLGAYALGCLALAGLMLWIAGDMELGVIVIAGFGIALGLYALLARALLALFAGGRIPFAASLLRSPRLAGVRIGLANLHRHAASATLQAMAIGLGLTALLLLSVVREDLIKSWRGKMPPDAPNHFIINIQPEQCQPLSAFFRDNGLPAPRLEPMIRGRLVAINDKPVAPESFSEERAKHLVDREFNLSWTATLPAGNEVVAGRWHGRGQASTAMDTEFSVEQGLAETLHLAPGDRLAYEIAGERIAGRITSLRKLEWDSLRVNFFVITPPGILDRFPSNFITSFHLPADRNAFTNDLVRSFPNLTIIDVTAVTRQLQSMLDQIVHAVETVFGFALLAGLLVLYAALQAGGDERRHEIALLRALGARHRQLRDALLSEFALLGAIAGLLAGGGSAAIGWGLARFVFHFDYRMDGLLLPAALLTGALGIALAGWLGVMAALRRPALEQLRNDEG